MLEEAGRSVDDDWNADLAIQQAAAVKQKNRDAMLGDYARLLNAHWSGVAVTCRLRDAALRRIAHDLCDEFLFRYGPILSVHATCSDSVLK